MSAQRAASPLSAHYSLLAQFVSARVQLPLACKGAPEGERPGRVGDAPFVSEGGTVRERRGLRGEGREGSVRVGEGPSRGQGDGAPWPSETATLRVYRAEGDDARETDGSKGGQHSFPCGIGALSAELLVLVGLPYCR